MRVGVVGINHKQAGLQLREKLAQTCQKRFALQKECSQNETVVLLSTCNRTEIFFTSTHLAETHISILHLIRQEVDESFDQKMYSFFGKDCLHHLSLVTAGLDSAVIWETEIQGQVKAAYQEAARRGRLPYELHYLFQKGLKNGKLLRRRYQGIRGVPDVEHAILELGEVHFAGTRPRVLFVGASAINLKILSHLKNKGVADLTLCNRTDAKAHHHAEKSAIRALPWNRFERWVDYDWIVFGTKSQVPLIHSLSHTHSRRQLIIDLSVPRNVNPSIEGHPHVTLHNIDQVHRLLEGRRRLIEHLACQADDHLADVVSRQVLSFQKKRKILPFKQAITA